MDGWRKETEVEREKGTLWPSSSGSLPTLLLTSGPPPPFPPRLHPSESSVLDFAVFFFLSLLSLALSFSLSGLHIPSSILHVPPLLPYLSLNPSLQAAPIRLYPLSVAMTLAGCNGIRPVSLSFSSLVSIFPPLFPVYITLPPLIPILLCSSSSSWLYLYSYERHRNSWEKTT